jgi:hypothetical protein
VIEGRGEEEREYEYEYEEGPVGLGERGGIGRVGAIIFPLETGRRRPEGRGHECT